MVSIKSLLILGASVIATLAHEGEDDSASASTDMHSDNHTETGTHAANPNYRTNDTSLASSPLSQMMLPTPVLAGGIPSTMSVPVVASSLARQNGTVSAVSTSQATMVPVPTGTTGTTNTLPVSNGAASSLGVTCGLILCLVSVVALKLC